MFVWLNYDKKAREGRCWDCKDCLEDPKTRIARGNCGTSPMKKGNGIYYDMLTNKFYTEPKFAIHPSIKGELAHNKVYECPLKDADLDFNIDIQLALNAYDDWVTFKESPKDPILKEYVKVLINEFALLDEVIKARNKSNV